MTYRYGVKAVVKDSIGTRPVSTGSCVLYIGAALAAETSTIPVLCKSYQDYLDEFHDGEEPASKLSLDTAADVAFNKTGIDHAWFYNAGNNTQSESGVSNDTIKAALDPASAYIVLNSSERPNLICCPDLHLHTGTASASDVIAALAALCNGKIADSYSAFGVVDCAEASSQVVSGKAVPAQIQKPSSDGHILPCWGHVNDDYPLSSVAASLYALQDASNTGNLPYRSIGNLNIPWAEKYGTADAEIYARQSIATSIAAKGVLTVVNLGGGVFHTWGDHTAAFSDGGSYDVLYQFDSSARMMIHLFNRFIDRWKDVVDKPMTLALRNDIINDEQNNLDYLVAIGALVGNPKCEFKAEENTEVASGYFYFSDTYTVTVPAKYVQLNLTYTTEGLKAYTE